MSRTPRNLRKELYDDLKKKFNVYLDRLPKNQPYNERYDVDDNDSLKSYAILTVTPFTLLTKDMRAAKNAMATRTGNIKIMCVAKTRDEADELAEEIDNYLMPDSNEGWKCSDGTPLETYHNWQYDPVNTNSEQTMYISTLIYRCHKNIGCTK